MANTVPVLPKIVKWKRLRRETLQVLGDHRSYPFMEIMIVEHDFIERNRFLLAKDGIGIAIINHLTSPLASHK